jgi:hypothetical protein
MLVSLSPVDVMITDASSHALRKKRYFTIAALRADRKHVEEAIRQSDPGRGVAGLL